MYNGLSGLPFYDNFNFSQTVEKGKHPWSNTILVSGLVSFSKSHISFFAVLFMVIWFSIIEANLSSFLADHI